MSLRATILFAFEPATDAIASEWLISKAGKHMEVNVIHLLPTHLTDIPTQVEPVWCMFEQSLVSLR